MKTLIGKYLVRKSKTTDGKPILIVCGTFLVSSELYNGINDNDEMWVSEITVGEGGIRFIDPIGTDGGSPEDFLEGAMQSPRNWKKKLKLD